MDYLPYSQEYMLAVSVMGGVIFGFIWDIYRLIRHYCKFKKLATAIGDILYWLISIRIGTELILDISYGNVRFFILLGFLGGALLYFFGISKYILKLSILIIDFILKMIKSLINFLIGPIKFLLRKLKILLVPIKLKYINSKEKLKRRYKFFKFKIKKVSKNRKMVYNKKKRQKRAKAKLNTKERIIPSERRTKNHRIKEKN